MSRRVPLFALVAASGIASAGLSMTLIAIPWFALQSTGSGTKTGLVAAMEVLGLLLSAVLGGPLVDRLGPRGVSVGADLLTTLAVGLVPLAHATVGLPLPGLLALTFLMGACRGPADTAKQVLLAQVVELVGTPAGRAASLVEAANRIGKMIGAPLAGALIAFVGPVNVLFADATTLLSSATLVLLLIPAAARVAGEKTGGYLADLGEGLAYVRRDRLLLAIVGMLMLTNGLDTGLSGVLYPAYGSEVLHSSALLGVMVTALGAGAVLGSMLYGWIGHRFSRWGTYVVCFLVEGAPRFALLALKPSPVVLLIGLGVAGLGSGLLNPILLPVVYERVPEHLRGRVFSLLVAGALAVIPVGTLLAGVLLDGIGLTGVLLTFGAVYLVATTFPLVFRVWRQLDARAGEPVLARS
ncbi:MFS transporter [Amycolatopsis sp. H20-H5]|uniref:MFS transporter n=1 Tax=Amycolatopsis sp. H20-H5 TaxID=3046309 RepID=UPI002DBA14F5|nr:MFS transporter [Amycolatopsis sp. H20-H5]MEC3979354.1 MFS transporter [Amycolatopsis sp. H20-H5]